MRLSKMIKILKVVSFTTGTLLSAYLLTNVVNNIIVELEANDDIDSIEEAQAQFVDQSHLNEVYK